MAKLKNGKLKSKNSKKSTGEGTSKLSPKKSSTSKQQQSQSEPQQHRIVPKGRSVICRIGEKSFKINYNTLKEIKRLQKSVGFCIPKLPFSRLLRELLQEQSQRSDIRMNADAIVALQEAAEMFTVNLLEDANLCAAHAKRLTVRPNDMKLAMTLRHNN